jgi:hypothetical protein
MILSGVGIYFESTPSRFLLEKLAMMMMMMASIRFNLKGY